MNLFVANINFKLTSEDLQEIFEEYGSVSNCKIIMDRETGKSKGFGFVEMKSQPDAIRAIRELNGAEVDGVNLVVKQARDNN
jgi:RNA recognition motif-containing protein